MRVPRAIVLALEPRGLTTTQLDDELRRRVLYYLVWRDLGGR